MIWSTYGLLLLNSRLWKYKRTCNLHCPRAQHPLFEAWGIGVAPRQHTSATYAGLYRPAYAATPNAAAVDNQHMWLVATAATLLELELSWTSIGPAYLHLVKGQVWWLVLAKKQSAGIAPSASTSTEQSLHPAYTLRISQGRAHSARVHPSVCATHCLQQYSYQRSQEL